MKMVIIRHGQTDANLNGIVQGSGLNPPLNSVGITQVETLGFNLKNYNIKEIYTSPLKRAQESAEIIANYTGSRIFIWPGLEELNFGDAEGISSEEAHKMYKDIFSAIDNDKNPNFDISIPNGETVNQCLERVVKSLKGIKLVSQQQVVAVVTHGTVMYNLYRHFFKEKRRFDNCEFFEFDA